jgi:hypothetical protein
MAGYPEPSRKKPRGRGSALAVSKVDDVCAIGIAAPVSRELDSPEDVMFKSIRAAADVDDPATYRTPQADGPAAIRVAIWLVLFCSMPGAPHSFKPNF